MLPGRENCPEIEGAVQNLSRAPAEGCRHVRLSRGANTHYRRQIPHAPFTGVSCKIRPAFLKGRSGISKNISFNQSGEVSISVGGSIKILTFFPSPHAALISSLSHIKTGRSQNRRNFSRLPTYSKSVLQIVGKRSLKHDGNTFSDYNTRIPSTKLHTSWR